MRIRPERRGEQDRIRRVHLEAFGDSGEHVANLADALRAANKEPTALCLVAVDAAPEPSGAEGDGGGSGTAVTRAATIVGHLVISFGWVDAPSRLVSVGVLSPIAVLPPWQRRGIGTALIRRGRELLAEQSVPLLFLEGDPGYYSGLGFRPGAELGFGKPSERIPDAAFQVTTLPTYEPWMSGPLVYPDTFWRLDAVGLR